MARDISDNRQAGVANRRQDCLACQTSGFGEGCWETHNRRGGEVEPLRSSQGAFKKPGDSGETGNQKSLARCLIAQLFRIVHAHRSHFAKQRAAMDLKYPCGGSAVSASQFQHLAYRAGFELGQAEGHRG